MHIGFFRPNCYPRPNTWPSTADRDCCNSGTCLCHNRLCWKPPSYSHPRRDCSNFWTIRYCTRDQNASRAWICLCKVRLSHFLIGTYYENPRLTSSFVLSGSTLTKVQPMPLYSFKAPTLVVALSRSVSAFAHCMFLLCTHSLCFVALVG